MTTKMNEDTRVKMAVYKPIFDKIAKVVGEHLGIDPKAVGRRDRHREYVKARKLICYYMREFSSCPLGIVGYMLNESIPFDHSNVCYMVKNIENEMFLKRPGGYFINEDLRNEDRKLRIHIKLLLPNIKMEEWLEDFSTSSGNFFN